MMEDKEIPPTNSKEGYTFVANFQDLPEGKGKVVTLSGKKIALFRIEDRCYAINDVCPHQGASLGKGTLKRYVVSCPWHHQQFDVRTGFGPDGGGYCVVNYDVMIDEGKVYVSLQKRDWLTGKNLVG